MKIGIIEGSIRQGRSATGVARWVLEQAADREGVEFELLDLAAFNLPMFDAAVPPMAANREYESEAVKAWSRAIDSCDGFIFVTPEYNHSIPAALKNAVDSLGPEWVNKSAACVAYGADGGVRAVEHWRAILANFNMYVIRAQVSLSIFTDLENGTVKQPNERKEGDLKNTLDQLIDSMKRHQ